MGKRRMISSEITDTDSFINLPSSAQALYMHLCLAADDDGFCDQITTCMWKAHAVVQDINSLLEAELLYRFDSGVIVIRHWRVMNSLRKDRYHPSKFAEKESLVVNNNTKEYVRLDHISEPLNCFPLKSHDSEVQMSCGTNIWNSITAAEIEEIRKTYENPDKLIDEVHDHVKISGIKVDRIGGYIAGYARNRNWPKKDDWL